MNDEVSLFILNKQKIEYAQYNAAFRLIDFSLGLPSFLASERIFQKDAFITDTFIELLGYEQYLIEVREGKKPPLQLDWINQISLAVSPEIKDADQTVTYFNLQVYPFKSGLLVVVRDISHESYIEQSVYNRRNELDILTRNLIEDLKEANLELNRAYQTTLEGWAKALELRDTETKGHSMRVVHLTQKLARTMGIEESKIVFYSYGALLHDIGKMGIPDRILLKPGPLNDSEWNIMKQHPVIAENLLSSIEFLGKSLDIIAFHHEKWNGKGYPYGLKGEEIPLPARIFSVVDVYDALTSDRPYRLAWAKNDVLQYIQEHSGIDFDPWVVEAFLSMISNQDFED
jgi:putative nucleotidyltransferase with HDIG domain